MRLLLTIKKLLFLLDANSIRNVYLLILVNIVNGLIEILGVVAIFPFMSIIADKSLIHTNIYLSKTYQIFNFESDLKFLTLLGLVILLILFISLFLKILTTIYANHFAYNTERYLTHKLFLHYLNQPYEWFLDRNISDLGKNILSEVEIVCSAGLKPAIDLVSQFFIVIGIGSMLFFVNPILALIVSFILIFSYIVLIKFVSSKINKLSANRFISNKSRHLLISDAFRGIKEIKVSNIINGYASIFDTQAKIYSECEASQKIISALPRYFLEGFMFGFLILAILFLIQNNEFSSIIPILSLYAFAGYKMLPSLQQIYALVMNLKYASPSINKVYEDFPRVTNINLNDSISHNKLKFKKQILLDNVSYKYSGSSKYVLKNLNMSFEKKSTIGIIGSTGSGKTTLLDLMLGLLVPSEGRILVDNISIHDERNTICWQKIIGYVPQDIHLIDDTVASNIAYGIPTSRINKKALIRAAKIANLHHFITNFLPHGYQTKIGDRGVKLSGGQRQRIGIARSMYNNPSIVILDEATSALDLHTENDVMDAISRLQKHVTLLVVTHRLSTLKNFNKIIFLKNGIIYKSGPYNEIINLFKKSNKKTK